MSNLRNKTAATMIALFLTLSVATPLFVQTVNAQRTYTTYPLIEALPNPIGVNQTTLINYGLLNYLNVEGDGWNVTVIVTWPDGTIEELGPFMTWSTGNAGVYYTPVLAGTYYLQTVFEETEYRNNIYLASESEELPLIVQEDPVPNYPGHALPSEYWTRPIDSQLREWYTLAGSWLDDPNDFIAPYNQGPESAHILWTRPIGDTMGGLVGGQYAGSGDHAYGDGDAYEGKWVTRLIVGGVLYYSKFESGMPTQELVAVDLHTGKQLWSKLLDGNLPSFGQILYWDSRNYRGAFSYLWVSLGGGFFFTTRPSDWLAFEPLTGEWRYNITDVPGGTSYYGDIGEILKYSITGGRLLRWNQTYVVNYNKRGMSEAWGSQVKGRQYNGANGYDLNVSIRVLETAGNRLPGRILKVFPGDRVIGGSTSSTEVNLWGLSLVPGSEGNLLFNSTWQAPKEWVEGNITIRGWGAFSQESLVATLWTKENRKNYAFSLETGNYMWETPTQHFADAWSGDTDRDNNIAYGKLYSASIGGTVYAYDIETGELAWTYNATDPYQESYISKNWWLTTVFITDGKIYLGSGEHSSLDPKPRGAPFICLNATDGTLIWRADGLFRQTHWGGFAIIGDSIIATMDTYDQRVYAVGKGPSTMTVSAPSTAVPYQTPVVISGSVMDVSPGTEDEAIKLRFPKGVPAVSDASMSDWMLYVYKQFEQPTDVTGVAVSIDAIDPNNNYVHLGDATTDASGMFSCMVTPEVPGLYTVYATFAGSAGYYASYAETPLGVMEATPATPAPEQVVIPDYTLAILGVGVAMIIAVAIATVLILRKK